MTTPMTLDDVDPRVHDALSKVPRLNLENRAMLWLIGRASRLAPGAEVEGVTRRLVHEGDLKLRVFAPTTHNGGALLWIHGGGFVLGSAAPDDRFCGETARELGITVISVDYRLAPQHPFPIPLDDVRAAWSWVHAHAEELGVDVRRIAVGGASAGGGLAATLVQRLHDEGEAVAAQVLFCPMLDDRTAADRTLDARDHLVWNNRSNLVGWRSYLGVEPGAAALPRYAAAARRTDLSGLPPTWSYTSAIELFAAEDTAYAAALEAAGVDVTFETLERLPHGFEVWGSQTEPARELFTRARAWLAPLLAPHLAPPE